MQQQQDCVTESYAAILANAEKMLESAEQGDWGGLINRQRDYVCQIELLAELEQEIHLDAERRETKLDILTRIRDHEQQLSEKLQARLSQLGELMTQSRNQVRINEAYDVTQGNLVLSIAVLSVALLAT